MQSAKWDRSQGRPEPIRALNRIPELENGEPLTSIIEGAPKVLILREQVIPFLRQRVVEMLKDASSRIGDGYRIGVIDAWRPIERQRRIFDFVTKSALEVWPDLNGPALKRKICRWVAPVDQKAPPGHCTGAAVDVVLCDENGEQLDVSSPFTRFSASATYTLGLTAEAQQNRMRLVKAMLDSGFSNCRDEWWHYSYGDAGWAVRMGESTCFYGIAHLPAELYKRQEELWLEAMQERQNPFLS